MHYAKSLAIAAALLTVSGQALAASATFTLNQVDSGAGLGTGPFGTITVTENAGALDFTQTLLSGFKIHETTNANHNAFAFKLLGDPAVTISGLASGFTANNLTAGSNISSPPFGTFFTAIACGTPACGNGVNGYAGVLSFKVTGTGALTLASLGFNTVGGQNVYFTTDLVNANGRTGNVGATLSAAVPEPASWGLMLLGFGMMGATIRRRHVRFAIA